MHDIEVRLDDRPGALAELGETLGASGISVEGGGAWVVEGVGVAHFLVDDGARARHALTDAGMRVIGVRSVVVQRLDQDTPGQLGRFTRALADVGVNIETLYSDHDHQLVVVVDDEAAARRVSAEWMARRGE